MSCWRFETGASHDDKCPRCLDGVDSAAHLVFECPKVAVKTGSFSAAVFLESAMY